MNGTLSFNGFIYPRQSRLRAALMHNNWADKEGKSFASCLPPLFMVCRFDYSSTSSASPRFFILLRRPRLVAREIRPVNLNPLEIMPEGAL